MTLPPTSPRWYVDAREVITSEHVSLDLTRHLPQRLAVGPAVIVCDEPAKLLPVIRKRWMRIIRETERYRSSTLDRQKRYGLERDISRMKALKFSTKPNEVADVLMITPSQTVLELPPHHTLYIASQLTPDQFASVVEHTELGSVVVVYGEWKMYERVLRAMCGAINDYGEGVYPATFLDG
ncbi:MAG TPA: hypothetical protein VFT16_04410 [Candidatus Saccharimonadales bacterium]|nr:hypothetical protein [Candidatus Saccharimonadales bacterium]